MIIAIRCQVYTAGQLTSDLGTRHTHQMENELISLLAVCEFFALQLFTFFISSLRNINFALQFYQFLCRDQYLKDRVVLRFARCQYKVIGWSIMFICGMVLWCARNLNLA